MWTVGESALIMVVSETTAVFDITEGELNDVTAQLDTSSLRCVFAGSLKMEKGFVIAHRDGLSVYQDGRCMGQWKSSSAVEVAAIRDGLCVLGLVGSGGEAMLLAIQVELNHHATFVA